MKYIGQCYVVFLDYTNMPTCHLFILNSNSTPKKYLNIYIHHFENIKIIEKEMFKPFKALKALNLSIFFFINELVFEVITNPPS